MNSEKYMLRVKPDYINLNKIIFGDFYNKIQELYTKGFYDAYEIKNIDEELKTLEKLGFKCFFNKSTYAIQFIAKKSII